MDLKRFFTDTIDEEYAYLSGDEFIHAVKVVRLKIGYKLIVCNNSGFDYYCTVKEIEHEKLTAKIDKKVANDTEIQKNITLYIGLNKDLDTVVQKAVELGVREIVPFTSQHCNVDKINYDRLNKIVLESSKQCGGAKLLKIGEVIKFEDIESIQKEIYAFYEFERNNKISDLPKTSTDIGVLIGCEGGFSQEEYQTMVKKGFHVLTLGKRILRVSTAVVSALTLVNEHIGEL